MAAHKSNKSGQASTADRAARVTMTDIAREAGCSQTTVSFVLNNVEDIRLAPETRSKVLDAARRLGYSPARKSAKKHKPTQVNKTVGLVGCIVDALSQNGQARRIIEGLSQTTRQSGLHVLIAQSGGDRTIESWLVDQFVEQRVKALIYMTDVTREVDVPSMLLQTDIPVVLVNCYATNQKLPTVIPGEASGGQRATRHLIEMGHRRIATITSEPWFEASADRLKGYRQALSNADIPYDPALVFEGDGSFDAGYEATRSMLDLTERPTAIFCQNDRTAMGSREALRQAGLEVPADMSIVAYDMEGILSQAHLKLTALDLPQGDMGRLAASLVQKTLSEARPSPSTARLEYALVERGSVVPPHPATNE